jgi:transcription elongation factor Elf1
VPDVARRHWICPRCGHEATSDPDARGMQHTCWGHDGELVRLQPRDGSVILYCGQCRQPCHVDPADLGDGEVWICRECAS